MNIIHFRTLTANIVRAISYGAVLLQWLWVLVIIVPPLVKTGAFDALSAPSQPTPTAHAEPLAASPLVWTIVGIITLIILVVTAIILAKIPRVITQTGDRVVHQATEAIIPALTQHKQLPAKKRRVLSRNITLYIQLTVVIIPALASLFLPATGDITTQIIMTIALLLAVISAVGFIVSWLVEPPKKATSRTRSHAFRG